VAMSSTNVLAQRSWNWTLFRHDGRLVLSVLCGSVAMYPVEIQLDDDEMAMFRAGGQRAVDRLARTVRDRPQDFRARHIAMFQTRPGVTEAAARWRAAR